MRSIALFLKFKKEKPTLFTIPITSPQKILVKSFTLALIWMENFCKQFYADRFYLYGKIRVTVLKIDRSIHLNSTSNLIFSKVVTFTNFYVNYEWKPLWRIKFFYSTHRFGDKYRRGKFWECANFDFRFKGSSFSFNTHWSFFVGQFKFEDYYFCLYRKICLQV